VPWPATAARTEPKLAKARPAQNVRAHEPAGTAGTPSSATTTPTTNDQRLRPASSTGSRWKVEDGFADGKELAALDEHQVRSWTSRHRWTILALLGHAFLSVLAAAQPVPAYEDQLIPLTRNEIRRLFTGLCQHLAAPAVQLHWSRWRRHHQAREGQPSRLTCRSAGAVSTYCTPGRGPTCSARYR
jgi:hypothetical protein